MNLTAIRDPDEIVTRHFGESLFAARHLFPHRTLNQRNSASSALQDSSAVSLADLGSGAGFPGIPIKLWAPQLAVTLIESNHKKATFLREITRALTLTDINIQTLRAESLLGDAFQVVTLRAVERFTRILPTAATLLAPQGRLALLIGVAQHSQATSTLPNFSWSAEIPIPLSMTRILLIGEKQRSLQVPA